MASTNPNRLLARPTEIGVGHPADIIVLNDRLQVELTSSAIASSGPAADERFEGQRRSVRR